MSLGRWQFVILLCGLATLIAWPLAAAAQTQNQRTSVVEAARRAREQRKNAPKAAQVWTNDNLASLSGAAVNVIGIPAQPPAPAEAKAEAKKPAAGAAEDKEQDLKKAEAELAEAKKDLERGEKELDLLQRDLLLQRQQHYTSPDYASDTEGKARLDSLAGQIEAKQGEVQRDKEKIAALEKKVEDLKHSSSPNKPESPPAEK